MKGTNLAVVCSASGLPQNTELARQAVWAKFRTGNSPLLLHIVDTAVRQKSAGGYGHVPEAVGLQLLVRPIQAVVCSASGLPQNTELARQAVWAKTTQFRASVAALRMLINCSGASRPSRTLNWTFRPIPQALAASSQRRTGRLPPSCCHPNIEEGVYEGNDGLHAAQQCVDMKINSGILRLCGGIEDADKLFGGLPAQQNCCRSGIEKGDRLRHRELCRVRGQIGGDGMRLDLKLHHRPDHKRSPHPPSNPDRDRDFSPGIHGRKGFLPGEAWRRNRDIIQPYHHLSKRSGRCWPQAAALQPSG